MLLSMRMTKNPVTVTPDMSVQGAEALMKQEKVHRLPVLDENKRLVGVISEKDILKATPSPATTLSAYEMNYLVGKMTVRQIMKKNPKTVSPDTTIEEAARMMVEEDLSSICVVDGVKLLGIVSKSDLFKMLLEMLGSRQYGVRVEFVVDDRPGVIATISTALAANGYNIVAFGTFAGEDSSTSLCTLKIQGGSIKAVKTIMKPLVREIIDVREF